MNDLKKSEVESEVEIKFDKFIDAVGSGSTRSRSILNLMMTASFISLLALYNSMSPTYNWLSSRLKSIQNAYSWVRFAEEDPKRFIPLRLNGSKEFIENRFTLDSYKKTFSNMPPLTGGGVDGILSIPSHLSISIPSYYINKDSTLNLSNIDTESVNAALIYISTMNSVSRRELDDLLRTFDRARIENALLIKIPILGISFDVNGLSIISAVAFGILFFLLYHSLSRERKNLKLVFKLAQKLNIDNLKLYQLLSMQQVLTVPSSVDEYILSEQTQVVVKISRIERAKNVLLRLLTLAPIVAPIIILAIIYVNDNKTEGIGNSINKEMTEATAYLSGFFGIIACIMLWFCVYEWYHIGKLWRKESLDIRDQLIGNLLSPDDLARVSWSSKLKKKITLLFTRKSGLKSKE